MSWTDPACERVADLMAARLGMSLPPNRRPRIEEGIRRAMGKAGAADLAAYRERLADDARAEDDLIDELSVGETYFFREPEQFDFIRRVVLPEARLRQLPGQPFRAWSAACSSGEEPYSLAMLLESEGGASCSTVLATDIAPGALERARRGSYGSWSLRGPEAERARAHLRPAGDRFEVCESTRRLVRFERLNLAGTAYPSAVGGTAGMDLILCRNVLIYLTPEVIRHAANRLFDCLAEGGWLITASTDPSLAGLAPWQVVTTEQGIFYRRGFAEAAPRPAAVAALAVPVNAPAPAGPVRAALADREAVAAPDREAEAIARVQELAAGDLASAERACRLETARHPLSSGLHLLRAEILLGLGDRAEATHAARRAACLDRSSAFAQFTLGRALTKAGDASGARRAFRNARDLAAALAAGEVIPLAEGMRAGELAAAAEALVVAAGRGREASP